MNVGDIMTTNVISCRPEDILSSVAERMEEQNIGCCPVLEEDRVVGVITDRDITTRAVSRGLNPSNTRVREIMTSNPITGSPFMSLEEACQVMAENQIRRLPIVHEGRLQGIVSLADLAIDLEEEELLAETLTKISETRSHV